MSNENDRKDVTYSITNIKIKDFEVKGKYDAPEIKGYDELYNVVSNIHKRYSNYIIQDAAEAKEINKRGGILTQLRAVNKKINSYKLNIHRAAKASYKDFDDSMDRLNNLIDDSITKIKQQVDKYNEQEHIRRLNDANKFFDEQVKSSQFEGKIPSWCTFEFMLNFYPKVIDEKDNKRNKDIIAFLAKVFKDANRIKAEYKQYNTQQFVKVAVREYRASLDIDASILSGINAHNEAIEIAKEIARKEIEKQKKLEQQKKLQEQAEKELNDLLAKQKDESNNSSDEANSNDTSNSSNSTNSFSNDLSRTNSIAEDGRVSNLAASSNIVHSDNNQQQSSAKIYYMFSIESLEDARKVKQFMDKNGIKYEHKKIIR